MFWFRSQMMYAGGSTSYEQHIGENLLYLFSMVRFLQKARAIFINNEYFYRQIVNVEARSKLHCKLILTKHKWLQYLVERLVNANQAKNARGEL